MYFVYISKTFSPFPPLWQYLSSIFILSEKIVQKTERKNFNNLKKRGLGSFDVLLLVSMYLFHVRALKLSFYNGNLIFDFLGNIQGSVVSYLDGLSRSYADLLSFDDFLGDENQLAAF